MKYTLREFIGTHKTRLIKESNNLDELKRIAKTLKAYEIQEDTFKTDILGNKWIIDVEHKEYKL